MRRILITLVVLFAILFVGVGWLAPVALSFYTASQARAALRAVPIDLKDRSVSQAPGTKLSYIGYAFEVPWTDLDESKTEIEAKNDPGWGRVTLAFESGLSLAVLAEPPQGLGKHLTGDSRRRFERLLGPGTATSDYEFAKNAYEFTPDKMHHWNLSLALHVREQGLLVFKSGRVFEPAETGIFNLQSQNYRGFQQGDPRLRPDALILDLYSDDAVVKIFFIQGRYYESEGVTQPEINRVVQSLHRAAPTQVATSTNQK
ncbi:MAG TPA: hypothetical protein VIW68_03920 [Candidatus Sulfotelmatobacter sp.]